MIFLKEINNLINLILKNKIISKSIPSKSTKKVNQTHNSNYKIMITS
jgi:hypothetical protein